MSNTVKRGRPRKVMSIKTVKMNDLSFSKGLFKPMRTKTKVDEFFSSDKGVMPGTNIVVTGDPGVGKTTVLLDVLADLQKGGKKCLFISPSGGTCYATTQPASAGPFLSSSRGVLLLR